MRTPNFLIFTIMLIAYASCTDQMDQMEEEIPSGVITSEQYDQLSRACMDDSQVIQLTQPLSDESNYTLNEYTFEIFAVVNLCEQFRSTLGGALFPPLTAELAAVDGISILDGNTAYEWSVDDIRYVYIVNDDGYQIRFYDENSLAGRELVTLSQDEDCERVDYIQYAVAEDECDAIGSIVFKYNFQKAGTAKIATFGNCVDQPSSEEYRLRVFEDLSGEIEVRSANNLERRINYAADGSGSFEIYSEGNLTDSGTWQL